MSEQKVYKERNTKFLSRMQEWVMETLLQSGEYGIGVLKIRVQDGIIQDVSTERLEKLMPDKEGKDEQK